MKTILLIALLGIQSASLGSDLLQTCISAAIAKSGAQPATLAWRSILTDTSATKEERQQATISLNAIYAAAVAKGRMEYLRITAQQAAASTEANQSMQRMFMIQSWQAMHPGMNIPSPYYVPR